MWHAVCLSGGFRGISKIPALQMPLPATVIATAALAVTHMKFLT